MIGSERPNLGQNSLTALSSHVIAAYTVPAVASLKKLSPTFRDYLNETLEVDAEERPDATQVLQHPFFVCDRRAVANARASDQGCARVIDLVVNRASCGVAVSSA